MSRRSNCHDKAVAENSFQLLKRKRVRWKTYAPQENAKGDVFEYIEMINNPKRKRTNNGVLSLVEFKPQHKFNAMSI